MRDGAQTLKSVKLDKSKAWQKENRGIWTIHRRRFYESFKGFDTSFVADG